MRLVQFLEAIEISPLLQSLAAEARKAPSFEEFQRDFIGQIKHGTYWHLTDNPQFIIDPKLGPRDLSSMAAGSMEPGKLMITSHLDHWDDFYNTDPETGEEVITRPYAALIDMSTASRKTYYQVSRGFGNEFFVSDPSKARVAAVMPIDQARKYNERAHAALPQSQQELLQFYQQVTGRENINEAAYNYETALTGGGVAYHGSQESVPALVLLPLDKPELKIADKVRAILIKPRAGVTMARKLKRVPGSAEFPWLWDRVRRARSNSEFRSLVDLMQKYPRIFKMFDLHGAEHIFKFTTTDLKMPINLYQQIFGEPPELKGKHFFQQLHNARVFFPDNMRASGKRNMLDVLETVYQHLNQAEFGSLFRGDIRVIQLPGRSAGLYYLKAKDIRIKPRITKSKDVIFDLIHEYGHKYWYEDMDAPDRQTAVALYNELRGSRVKHEKDTRGEEEIARLSSQIKPGMIIDYVGRKEIFKKQTPYKIMHVKGTKYLAVSSKSRQMWGTISGLFNDRKWKVRDVDLEMPSEPTSKYDIVSKQWFPTKYSQKTDREWWAELFAFHVLGHLEGTPEEWMRQILGK